MTQDSQLTTHDFFMHRCLQLAKLGAGYVSPNPMVGAVLVNNGRIIGEGYHKKFGEAHAEVNCLNSVKDEDRRLIPESVLYVSLEPCSHFGKTAPCTDLIIKNRIPKVVIGCGDPSKEVKGKGVEKLIAAGVRVEAGILEKECKEFNKRFFTFHTQHRPYIILKWAETADGKIAPLNPPEGGTLENPSIKRLLISNEYTNRLVHKWRSEESSILVGTNTALLDNPELTTRNWSGPSPVRLVVDMDLKLPASLKVFNDKQRTVIFNTVKHEENGNPAYYQVTEDVSLAQQIVNALYQMKIQSVIVEGGARLLQSFIDEDMWDEARVICNKQLTIGNGLSGPGLPAMFATGELTIENDLISFYQNHAR